MYGFSALLSSQQYTFMTEGKSEICLSNPGKYLCFNNIHNSDDKTEKKMTRVAVKDEMY